MRILNHSARNILLGLVASLYSVSSPILAQSNDDTLADPVGRILSTRGLVIAESENGTVRELTRRSPVYEGDVVITSARGRTQIRFNDNGLIGLRPDTHFEIAEHVFNGQEDGSESATYRLLSGGIQAITGQIGDQNKSRYRFETPVASIALRGTHWAATFCNTSCGDLPPGLYGGVAEGGIDVCNGGGCEGFDKDGYFYVPDANEPPQTLLDPPPVVFDDSTDRNDDQGGDDQGESSGGSDDATGNGSDTDEQTDDGENEAEDSAENSGADNGNSNLGGTDSENSDSSESQGSGDSDNAGGASGESTSGFGSNSESNPASNPTTTNNDPANTNADGTDTNSPDPAGEQQSNELVVDADSDGIPDTADPDADGDGVENEFDPSPTVADDFDDTDGDGIADIVDSDADGDGVLDDLGETPAGFVAIDSDGDGIGDTFEEDTDGDGIANSNDPDADGNGILDELGETPAGFVAVDTDGDGISDTFKEDSDGDGIANSDDPDADGNGVLDELGQIPAGFIAVDTDGDGISDALAEDSDGDGIANSDDPDADGNGILDELGQIPAGFIAVDTDGDGISDALAEDSDGDGIANSDDPDADGNGILDELGEVPSNFVALDTDGDGIADTLSKDSDGDGIPDINDPTPNGTPDITPEPDDPEPTVAIAFALVNDRPSNAALNDLVRSDDSRVSIAQNSAGSVTTVNQDDDDICDPCLVEVDFSSSTPVLNDSITYTSPEGGITVALGRWTGTINNSENGSSFSAPDFHFLVTEQIATSLPNPDATITYSLENGAATSPTDGSGSTGSLDFLELDFDFSTQELVFVDLEANFDDGRQYLAGLVGDAVNLVGVANSDIALLGSCSGGSCGGSETIEGFTSFLFLEEDSETAVAGSYSLNTSSFSSSIAGAYVLEPLPDGGTDADLNPLDFNRDLDTDLDSILNTSPDGVAAVANIIQVPIGGDAFDFSSVATLASSNVAGQSFELIDFTSRLDTGSDPSIAVSAYSASETGQINSGIAASTMLTVDESVNAYYGYWSDAEQNFTSGVSLDTLGMIPFAFSSNSTSALPTTSKAFYSFRGGNAFSELGEVIEITDVDMTVDFFSQMIDDFSFSANSLNATYTADIGATDGATPPFVNLTSATNIFIPLVGQCDGCAVSGDINVLEGGVNLSFIGNNAEGAIGAVQLDSRTEDSLEVGTYNPDGQHSLAGAFVLEQDLSVPNSPADAVALSSTVLNVDAANSIAGTLGSRSTLSVSGTANGSDGINLLSHVDDPTLIPVDSLGVVSASLSSNFSALDELGAIGNPACFICIDVNVDVQNPATQLLNSNSRDGTGFSAFWGRWSAAGHIEYLSDQYSAGDIHFIYSEDISDLSALGTTTTISYTYNPANTFGTSPTDQLGNVGSLDRVEMDINFGPQAIERFEMDLSFDVSNVWSVVMKDASVPLNDNPVTSFEVVGAFGSASVQNTGVVFGDVNTTILGPTAAAVIGSFNLSVIDNALPANEAVGTFLLEDANQIRNPAPSGAVALNTAILDAGTDTELSSAIEGTGKDAISVSAVANISSVGLIAHENGAGMVTENAVVQGIFSSELTSLEQLDGDPFNGSFTCTDCFDMNLQPSPTDLSDTVKHVGTNYTAYWGRWSDQQVAINLGSGNENYNAADSFYAYSEDLTPDTSSAALGASTISFSKLLGSNPIDQDGVSGILGAVDMDINFGSQQITSFDMNITTADGDWDAHLPYVTGTTVQDPIALSGAINSFAVEGLASDPTGGITAAGTSTRYDVYGDVNTALLGPNADAVLGTYNLSVIDTLGAPQDAEAIGTFLLEQD